MDVEWILRENKKKEKGIVMSLKRRFISEIPEETAHVAKQIHGKGNIYGSICVSRSCQQESK